MQNPFGYKIQAKLYESSTTLVFRAKRDEKNSIILKVLKLEHSTDKLVQRYRNEYELTLSLKSLAGVINTYGLEKDGDKWIMLMEDFGAISLDKLLNQTGFSLEQVLDISIAVTKSLDEIHSIGIIHKDINPSNIVMNPNTGQVKIIGLGIASAINNEEIVTKGSNIIEGTLSYIPPEQTGRIDRAIDQRADLYSFGATLYELLALKPPFTTSDQMDLIHCHLAKEPIPLSSICPDIPEAVSKIVMKLMSKDVEERYATAKGAGADLQKCLDSVKKGDRNFSFAIGNEENPHTLKIPQKLFGREKGLEQLQARFQLVLAGNKNIVFFKGPAGIGKTFLINGIEQYVCEKNGIYIKGKFNLLQQSIPYSGIIQAFRQLARYLLTRSDPELVKWQKKLTKILGNQGYEIIELVPEFEKIFGPRSPISGSGGHEARNRFYLMVENFLSVFTRQKHPLVIFLDDLQWVDPSSLELIKQIMSSSVIESVFIICTFRDNEVDAEHPLQKMFEKFKNEKMAYQCIPLSPLDVSAISQMIGHCLECSTDKARPLAQWIHTRSLGNPFYGNELLVALNEQGKLVYDTEHNRWTWDLKNIQALSLPNSITELLAKKIQVLAESTRKVLILAACIGTRFELNTLTMVCESSRDEILAALESAIKAGLILPMEDKFESAPGRENTKKEIIYRFAHDRIHSGAYNLMPPEQKPGIHWQTGQLLFRKLSAEQREARTFEIVNHLNKGRFLLNYAPEKKQLAQYNLKAGQKAKTSAAFDQAYTYFMVGINLLGLNDDPNRKKETSVTRHWQESYELISTLYLGAIETAFLSTRFDEVQRLGTVFLANAANLSDELRFYGIKVQACYALNQMEEAVSTALYALGLAGTRISEKPKKWEIIFEYLKTQLLLSGKSMDSLSRMSETTEPEKLIILNIMRNTLLPSYYVNADLFPILVLKAIRISVHHGGTIDSAFAFAGYGIILSGVMGKREKGYQFGCLAVQMLEGFNTSELGAKILVTVSTFTIHWKKHLKTVLPLLEKAYEKGFETGDFEFTAIASHLDSYYRFFLGENLIELAKRGEINKRAIKRLKQETIYQYQNMHLQTISNLREKCDHPHKLQGRYYDEALMLPIHVKANDKGALFNFYLQKTILCFLFDESMDAVENASMAEKYRFTQNGATDDVQFCFYLSLSILSAFDTDNQKTKRLKQVKRNQKQMKKWAKSAPMNYEHKYLLVAAEYNRVKKQPEKSAALYDRAIKKAREHGYLQDAAIASELAGSFYLRVNNLSKARDNLEQAWHGYLKWGATAKLFQLEIRYPDMFPVPVRSAKSALNPASYTIFSTPGKILDWDAVLEASVSISSEIYFEKLIEKLMQIITKNTGAQRGILFLQEKSGLKEAAVFPVLSAQAKILNPICLENHSQVPKSVIHYVERMRESIIFDTDDPLFRNDPYIIAHRPKSLLCFPLQYKSNLMGIFYLENNLVPGIFTDNSLEILKILSAQISVSLENARLYRDLEEQTKKLKSANKKLREEVDQRAKMEAELKTYRDQLKKELDTQALELLKSKQILASIATESNPRHRFQNIISKSDKMQRIYDLIEDLADVTANVLILGESGTGKELVAQAIHCSGKRKNLPFVRVNCSALSESLLESELFGHVKGAFTGAENNKIGRFQKAGKGSILLDEIGDVTLHFQKRLLRVLQEREFEQLGDTKTIKMHARVIASTNKDLVKKVKEKSFRQDLYYRLKVMEIKIPSLRERKEDIPLLISHFLLLFNNEMSKNILRVSEGAYKMLMSYHWPGNIRELRNIIEHSVVTCKGSVIATDDLPRDFNLQSKEIFLHDIISTDSYGKEEIVSALGKAKWNKTEAAKLLGMSRRTLYRKLKLYSIQ